MKILIKGFTLGIAIVLTFIVSTFILGFVFSIIPFLAFFGDLAWIVNWILLFVMCGLVGAVVFKYIH